MSGELYLIYINIVGVDYKGDYIYEFIFSDTTKDVDGPDWDVYPASNKPEPPHKSFIKKVGRVETELKLDAIQQSDTFCLWDSIDGIIALGWEDINDYPEYPEKRLYFNFGETIGSVEDKLYERELILDYGKYKKDN